MKIYTQHQFRIEKAKRKSRGIRLIDANIKNEMSWMYWPIFRRWVWVVLIWSACVAYFIYKYFAQ